MVCEKFHEMNAIFHEFHFMHMKILECYTDYYDIEKVKNSRKIEMMILKRDQQTVICMINFEKPKMLLLLNCFDF